MKREPVTLVFILCVSATLNGCGAGMHPTLKAFPEGIEISIPADSLASEVALRLVQAMPAIPIVASRDGQIASDWLDVPGRTTGILFWKHRWQARVKHYISITRSYAAPLSASVIMVSSEVEERPNSKYGWKPGDPELARPAEVRLRDLLKELISHP
jgi:hypothetical protein